MPDLVNILASNDVSKRGGKEVISQGKSPSRNQTGARVVRCEGRHRERRFTMQIHLGVECPHGEDRHLPGAELIADDSLGAVGSDDTGLWDHLSDDAAVEDEEEFRGTIVDVERCHAAGYCG